MGRDQMAEIAPGVREALAGGPSWCATFTISGDPERWVQFTDGVINAAYPHHDAPESRLAGLDAFALTDWTPDKYVTGTLALSDARSVAGWIDRYFIAILRCDRDYAVDVVLERL